MAKRAQKSPGGGAASTGANATNPDAPQVGSVVNSTPTPSAKTPSNASPKTKSAAKTAAKKPAKKTAAKPKPTLKPAKPILQPDGNSGLSGPGLYGPGPFWPDPYGGPYWGGGSGTNNGGQGNFQAQPQAQPQAQSQAQSQADFQASPQANSPSGGMRMGKSENYLDFLARVFQNMGTNSWDAQQFDSVTQGMTLVLGSGPAFAALESMMANTTAQSAVLMNAVQTQRQLDQVGLCCTSACVQQLLNMNNNQDRD